MNDDWLGKIIDIFEADTGDLRELAEVVSADPKRFYRGADLSKADLSGQDLRGIDFTGATLDGAIFDSNTKVDLEFYPSSVSISRQRYFEAGVELENLIMEQSRRLSYQYDAWTIKHLVTRAHALFISDYIKFSSFIGKIKRTKSLNGVLHRDRWRRVAHRFKIEDSVHLFVMAVGREFLPNSLGYSVVIMVGLLIDYGIEPSDINEGFDLAMEMRDHGHI